MGRPVLEDSSLENVLLPAPAIPVMTMRRPTTEAPFDSLMAPRYSSTSLRSTGDVWREESAESWHTTLVSVAIRLRSRAGLPTSHCSGFVGARAHGHMVESRGPRRSRPLGQAGACGLTPIRWADGEDSLNWDALGAIGEVIGAVAVLATLIYLAVQTRQNTRAVQHAASRGVMEDANAWRFRVVENPEISEFLRAGLRDPDSLSANDKYRFRMLLDSLVFHWQHAVAAGEALPIANITRMLGTPGGAWYWSRAKDVLTPEFIEYVDGLLADPNSE